MRSLVMLVTVPVRVISPSRLGSAGFIDWRVIRTSGTGSSACAGGGVGSVASASPATAVREASTARTTTRRRHSTEFILGWRLALGRPFSGAARGRRGAVDCFPVPDLQTAPVVDRLGALFADAGHELHLVGGSIRDALLGELGHDLDFTTSARPDTVEALLRRFSPAVWTIGKEYGNIGCRVHEAGADWVIEVTTYRSDAYAGTSRKPVVAFGDTLEGDLVRRDFTINAMALSLPDKQLHDPYGGLSDPARGVIRTPAAPEISFGDDPLRMMRAARFAAQLEFEVAPEVIRAMTSMADRIAIISAERVRDELSRLLLAGRPRRGLDLLVSTGLADRVLPELPALRLERDEHHPHKDVYQHSLTVLEQAIALEESRLPERHDEDVPVPARPDL